MKTLLRYFLFLIAVLVLGISAAKATDITVDGTTCTLPDAITAANTDSTGGGCTAGSGDDTIILQTNVTLAATLPQISSTITIEGNGRFISGNNDTDVGSVLYITASGNLTLNEVTVTEGAGCIDPSYGGRSGGGIYNGGTVTLSNSTVSGNSVYANAANSNAYASGGGINNSGTATLNNSTVSGNSANADTYANAEGGGINNKGTLILDNSTVSGNSADADADADAYAWGGGINNWGTATLNNSTVNGNSASSTTSTSSISIYTLGGGIHNWGTVTLNNSTVSGNSANAYATNAYAGAEASGGGINNFYAILTLSNSTVSGNSANAYATNANAYAGAQGGGIYSQRYQVMLNNSTISGNSANAANAEGGGMYNTGEMGGTVTLNSSLISGNTANKGNEVYKYGNVYYVNSFNLFGHSGESSTEAFVGFTPGVNDINATGDCDTNEPYCKPTALSAILNPLADNGGPTWTHALVGGSPAIDLDAACSTNLDTDQRGYPRPETEGTGCDAGAFEGSISLPGFLPAVYLLLL